MMMIFSNDDDKSKFGFDCYQTDNIYQFLLIAKEVRPDVVVMKFTDEFQTDEEILSKIKEALCKDEVCPKIYMNMPENFEGERFFENVDFEKEDIKKYLN